MVRLRLVVGPKNIVCSGKIARRFEEDSSLYCGIAFMDLSARDMAGLSLHLYGEDEPGSTGGGA